MTSHDNSAEENWSIPDLNQPLSQSLLQPMELPSNYQKRCVWRHHPNCYISFNNPTPAPMFRDFLSKNVIPTRPSYYPTASALYYKQLARYSQNLPITATQKPKKVLPAQSSATKERNNGETFMGIIVEPSFTDDIIISSIGQAQGSNYVLNQAHKRSVAWIISRAHDLQVSATITCPKSGLSFPLSVNKGYTGTGESIKVKRGEKCKLSFAMPLLSSFGRKSAKHLQLKLTITHCHDETNVSCRVYDIEIVNSREMVKLNTEKLRGNY